MKYTTITSCRVCGSESLEKYLDLGDLPLTNNLCINSIEMAERYPLRLCVCMDCWLSQLSIAVDPETLFGNYVYRSSISTGFKNHCREMAKDLKYEYGLTGNSFMIDIAGNDGCLLNEFRQEIGIKILNIDPARNLAGICQAREIPTLTYFWEEETARRAVNGFGQADLITATNVFAHVNNVKEFLSAVKIALKPGGVLVMEFPYLIDFIEHNEFDTIYHEHLSYFSVYPLDILCKKSGLNIMKVEKQAIHGGSVRVHVGYGERGSSVDDFIINEAVYRGMSKYNSFSVSAGSTIKTFRDELNKLKVSGYKIAGFAASAKGNTLLNSAGVMVGTLSYIVDETPGKIGMFSPGTHLPIVSMFELISNPPDFLVILSWNFKDEIMQKCVAAGYEGKFIIPIPEFQIL